MSGGVHRGGRVAWLFIRTPRGFARYPRIDRARTSALMLASQPSKCGNLNTCMVSVPPTETVRRAVHKRLCLAIQPTSRLALLQSKLLNTHVNVAPAAHPGQGSVQNIQSISHTFLHHVSSAAPAPCLQQLSATQRAPLNLDRQDHLALAWAQCGLVCKRTEGLTRV